MAKITTTNFSSILEVLNNEILYEVKNALALLPEQMMEGPSLCRIIVSRYDSYEPKDVYVDLIWLHNAKLYFDGHIVPPDWQDPNIDPESFEGGEDDTDWLNIVDFQYLIEQMRLKMPTDGEPHMLANLFFGPLLENTIKNNTVTY